ncbi:hypothetical protein SAMN06295967_101382 [Belliella buryatensis]|uniref:Uncharacterized protein n=1 Tax=Belliella buryatensis TaxID=1500549 RepID=A0A239ATH9_9BACT|nr:DUF5995 family protein [Belliella buryatensis]SNR98860.1 hypothetical protein SAMN06295967_101382 [Belliella buryatensis]
MKTISDVIHRMDQIIAECHQKQSRLGYFAILYRQVTIRVAEGISCGEFEDNARMEVLDVIFAKRFIDAYEAYIVGKPITLSWQKAFVATENSKYIILQHLLLGINAHINLDLGIAAVQTVGSQPLATIKNDFDKINAVLSELVDSVKTNIGKLSPVFNFLIRFAKGRDEILVNFSIQLARDGAWKFAQSYETSDNRTDSINIRDQIIAGLAEGMINPGKRLSRIISLISLTEWRSVSSNMTQLDEVVKKIK